jgi:hypothetical protein
MKKKLLPPPLEKPAESDPGEPSPSIANHIFLLAVKTATPARPAQTSTVHG